MEIVLQGKGAAVVGMIQQGMRAENAGIGAS
jgi:hypothetical protein